MKNLLTILILFFIFACSSQKIEKQEEVFTQESDQKIYNAIDSGVFAEFQEALAGEDLRGKHELHNFVAAKCSSQYQTVSEQMALMLIKKGVRPLERNYRELNAPLRTSLERGCTPLVQLYLNSMSPQEIARLSMDLKATDFINFTEKILDREPQSYELILVEQRPISVDLAIQKNSELCLNEDKNCLARDHLLKELENMKQAVARFAYHKACVVQIEMFNTLQSMNEQVEFARATGVASPVTYDEHVGHAQELKGWFQYYDTLFYKMTGESADLSQCYL